MSPNPVPDGTDGDAALPSQANDIAAVFYDGNSNRKRRVALQFNTQLDIVEDGGAIAAWPYADTRRVDSTRAMRLSCVSAPALARLEIEDKFTADRIEALCPSLDAAQSGKQTGRIVAWSLAAACSIILVTVFGIPLIADRMAPLVPFAIEKRMGEAVDRQARAILGGRDCTNPEGQAAFTKMVSKLKDASGFDTPLEAHVLSSSIPNAFALPGGKIYLLDGLLTKARNVDEVAGVLAHELGHAHSRDGLRKMIQTGGSSFLIGLLFGDVMGGGAVLFAARSIIDASYSRDAETRADDFAIHGMHALGRSPEPLGELLVRMTGGSRVATIIDSHPVSAERLERMKKDKRPVTGEPILTDREWKALKDICKAERGNTSTDARPARKTASQEKKEAAK
jgi:predicted Zn-dependent protease